MKEILMSELSERLRSVEINSIATIDIVSNLSQKDSKKIIYTSDQVQKLLGISRKTLQKWRDNGIIQYSKIGAICFYTHADIDDMLDKHKVNYIVQSQN